MSGTCRSVRPQCVHCGRFISDKAARRGTFYDDWNGGWEYDGECENGKGCQRHKPRPEGERDA